MFFNSNKPMNETKQPAAHDSVERRLQRLESRMVRLMQHFGLDPYEQVPQQYRKDLMNRGNKP